MLRPPTRGRSGARPLAVAALAIACGLGVVPAAVGDPGGSGGSGGSGRSGGGSGSKAMPSKQDVAAARERAAGKAQQVGAVKARLAQAQAAFSAASLQAEEASEAYNGAQWRLSQARHAYTRAQADAAHARTEMSSQQHRLGALVVQSYQQSGELSALDAVVSADGPQGVLDRYTAYRGASSSLEAGYQRLKATESLAEVYEATAKHARTEQVALAAAAERAQSVAVQAATAARSQEATVASEQDRLVHELARAQHISVSLARSRQDALAALARKRAEEKARQAAEAAARAQAVKDAAAHRAAVARQQAAAAAAARVAQAARSAGQHHAGGAAGAPASTTSTTPAPAPVAPAPVAAPAPPVSGGGAAKAIAFAEAQLGEPYVWAAAGPSSWDCSGLTMQAWASAGVSLPHYSVAQYERGTPIPISQVRPGDLLFWSSNGRPSGIHHVALSLGGSQFIEAPHTGASVRYNSIYAWYPTFAVRL